MFVVLAASLNFIVEGIIINNLQYYIEWLYSNEIHFNHSRTPAASVDSISCDVSMLSGGRAPYNIII